VRRVPEPRPYSSTAICLIPLGFFHNSNFMSLRDHSLWTKFIHASAHLAWPEGDISSLSASLPSTITSVQLRCLLYSEWQNNQLSLICPAWHCDTVSIPGNTACHHCPCCDHSNRPLTCSRVRNPPQSQVWEWQQRGRLCHIPGTATIRLVLARRCRHCHPIYVNLLLL
jgi:hypothetical protein